jgi:uncharacterized protein YvpB
MIALRVPLISQLGAGSSRYVADCGVACVAMCLAWAGKDAPTVDQLASETTLAQLDLGLDPVAISDLLRAHGVNCRVNGGTHAEDIKRELDAGRPVIVALLWQGRRHALLVTGWDVTGFMINDPATVALHVTYAQLDRGLVDIQLGRQCVFVTDSAPPPLTGRAITTGAANVRKAPLGKVFDTLPAGTVVSVEETANGWSRIKIEAYVATELLRKAQP